MYTFTARAQQVLVLARKEANRYHHSYVGTEHLLLGMIKLGQGEAVNVLERMGIILETVRMEVEKEVGSGPPQKAAGAIPYTPRVKMVLAFATKEAKVLNHSYVGTEHLLLGMLRVGESVAARVLKLLDVDIQRTRNEIITEIDPTFSPNDQDDEYEDMESKTSEEPQNMQEPESHHHEVDTNKRYDVYCREDGQELVIYRRALFKSRRMLLSNGLYGSGSEFLELEQSNGQTVYLSALSLVKFCEPDTKISGVSIPHG